MDHLAQFDGKGVLLAARPCLEMTNARRGLLQLGAVVMGPICEVDLVVALINGGAVDAAIIDVGLDVEKATAIAELLECQSVPLVFALAELRSEIPARFAGYRLVIVADELRFIAQALFPTPWLH